MNRFQVVYKVFLIHLFAGLINELVHNNSSISGLGAISSAIYYLIETQCFLYVFLQWIDVEKLKQNVYQVLFMLLWLIDLYLKLILKYAAFNWMYMFMLAILVILGINVLTKNNNGNAFSRRFIVIPIIVYAIYWIAINILMALLYNKHNQQLFINLYSVINLINFLSYSSYSLALIWAPKKEKYL